MTIYKAYDIRGEYPEQLNDKTAFRMGQAFAALLKPKIVLVARDCRISSPALFDSVTKGLVEQGVNLIDIGLATTPMFNFAVWKLGCDAGVMVTASHDPKEYNGFKFCRKDAVPVYGSEIKKIEQLVKANDFEITEEKGRIERKDVIQDYVEHLLGFAGKINPSLKIVIDAGNGMAGLVLPKLIDKLPCKIIPLFFELNSSFPSRPPDPTIEKNLVKLQSQVIKNKADLGIAFDGDADRVIFVDEEGNSVAGDLITALLASYLLEKNKGEKIIYTVRSSKVVKEEIESAGGQSVKCRVGSPFIKALMKEENALFAGEYSGHYYFRENNFTDSGILAMLKVLELVSKRNRNFSDLIRPLKRYFSTKEINFKAGEVSKILDIIERSYLDATNTIHLDGISVHYPDWWFILRKSQTEPMLRLRIEANNKALLEKKKKELIEKIKSLI